MPDSKLNSSVPTDPTNAAADANDASLASPFGKRDSDWELAFWRSEMLRRFKTDLLGNLGHELRSPLSSQLGSLDLVLSGLCETQSEIQEFLGAARQSAQNHLQLIIDCIALSRYESPVLPLSPRPISLSTVLKPVEPLLLPIAKDRGLRLEWTISDVDLLADPHGCEQIVLGLGMWSLGQLIHGTLSVMVDRTPLTMGNDSKAALEDDTWNQGPRIVLATTGQLRGESSEREALYWHVPRMMLEAMGGQLLRTRDGDCQQTLSVQFPTNSLPAIP
ncbi:MAG: sensor histidine kinase [Synechococcus sp.]